MIRRWAALALCLSLGSMVSAQEEPGVFVTYSMEMDGSKVKGWMMIAKIVDNKSVPQGYALQRVVDFVTEDCASGKVRGVKLRKKRLNERDGYVAQRFGMICLGGPHRSIGAPTATVTIERQEDGRDLAQYEIKKDGEVITSQRYR